MPVESETRILAQREVGELAQQIHALLERE